MPAVCIRHRAGSHLTTGSRINTMASRTIRALLSFVGSNDAGKMLGGSDGAVLTVFKQRKFDEVHLFWNTSEARNVSFEHIAGYLKNELLERGYCNTVLLHRFDCDNVTDHNEIYPKLLDLCRSLKTDGRKEFTAAIASGTPAMQVCWILMAESGDFPVELIRSNEPRFGKAPVTPIRLATGLPRIIRLEQENEFLRKEHRDLIPDLHISISKGAITIAGVQLPLSPVEFCYYRYFAERARDSMEFERFSGIAAPAGFLKKIIAYHRESFPEADLFRKDLEEMMKRGRDLDIRTVRGNISKANKKIRGAISNPSWVRIFEISSEGKKHSLHYGIRSPAEKVHLGM